jgi:hypothetical protein
MKKKLKQARLIGYFNGHKFPIQIYLSKPNITLMLQPGEFIMDTKGRKVNDPFFEVYAKNNQLTREIATDPVPIIELASVTNQSK